MYRSPGGVPPTADRCVIVPGVGIGPAVVGRSSAEEILAWFGSDCRVSRFDAGGEIFELSYDYENDEDYDPDRAAQDTRPATFDFEFGLLKSIEVGVYQLGLATREGIRIDSSAQDVLRSFGRPPYVIQKDTWQVFRYVDHGVDIDVGKDEKVSGLTVFRARW